VPAAAPGFGQHSDAVLKDAGLTDAQIEALRAQRAVL
jgi:crotonobetainyl-CoA:carnitine CoA-transferase CaiB-like acyl-CoA transferase